MKNKETSFFILFWHPTAVFSINSETPTLHNFLLQDSSPPKEGTFLKG